MITVNLDSSKRRHIIRAKLVQIKNRLRDTVIEYCKVCKDTNETLILDSFEGGNFPWIADYEYYSNDFV